MFYQLVTRFFYYASCINVRNLTSLISVIVRVVCRHTVPGVPGCTRKSINFNAAAWHFYGHCLYPLLGNILSKLFAAYCLLGHSISNVT